MLHRIVVDSAGRPERQGFFVVPEVGVTANLLDLKLILLDLKLIFDYIACDAGYKE